MPLYDIDYAEVSRSPLEAMHVNLQLEHSYNLDEMYGKNYGYCSGLNASVVTELEIVGVD